MDRQPAHCDIGGSVSPFLDSSSPLQGDQRIMRRESSLGVSSVSTIINTYQDNSIGSKELLKRLKGSRMVNHNTSHAP